MIFHFPGQITPETLLKDIEPFVQALMDAGVTHLSSMYISTLCFADKTECQITLDNELVSQMYFDPATGEDAASVSRKLRNDGSAIIKRPASMPYGGLGVLFNHND